MAVNIQKLSKKIRANLDTEELLILLDRAIKLLPQEHLAEMFSGFFKLDEDDDNSEEPLLAAIQLFFKESLNGAYYESFNVNSRNYMDKSRGTINFIDEYGRLLDRCVDEIESTEPASLREAFELMFQLLDEIDECRDDIIFFADEGGSSEIFYAWDKIFPVYFKVLAAIVKPKEYVETIIPLIKRHSAYNFDRHIQSALKAANPSQKKVIKAALA
jgi:hypothetical protein